MKNLSVTSVRRWFTRACLACLAVSLVGSLFADVKTKADDKKKKSDVVIPEAREITKTFVASQTTEVELVAAVGSLKQATFIIREMPQHGTLSAIKSSVKESNKATVTYTHRDVDVLADKFTYACRVDDGPVSAAAVVTLVGQILEPKLEIVEAPRIGKVFLGGEESGIVKVKNSGVAPYSSELKWEAPWSGPPTLEVKPGETQSFRLTFRPSEPGEFRMERLLQKGFEASKLVEFGECARALSVSPTNLTLVLNNNTGNREATLTLFNNKPEPLKVNLTLPQRLTGLQTVELLARGKQEVVFTLAGADVEAFRGDLELSNDGDKQKVMVSTLAKPGELKLVSPLNQEIDLGSLDTGAEASGVITVQNSGGGPLLVDADVLTPFSLDTQGSAFRLEPAQQRQIRVTLKSQRAGPHSAEVKLLGGGKSAMIKVKADVLESKKSAMPEPSPQVPLIVGSVSSSAAVSEPHDMTLTPAQLAMQALLASTGMPMSSEQINPYLDRVQSVDLVKRDANSLSLTWKRAPILPSGWRLDYAGYMRDERTNLATKVWQPFKDLKVFAAGADKIGVTIEKLTPATQYDIRIVAFDREGKMSEPSPVFTISTAPAWTIPSWFWRSLVFFVLAAALFVLYRVRMGNSM